MNGQQRANYNPNYDKINIVKMIKTLQNYRGYNKILFIMPFPNTYLGYLDDNFFGYTVDEKNLKLCMMSPEKAIDHYLDNTFFHNASLEYNTFFSKKEFRSFVNALNMVKEKK